MTPKQMHVVLVVGARPQFIKAKPLYSAISSHNHRTDESGRLIRQTWIHTGQHYDHQMSEVFFQDLVLPAPHYNLGVGSGDHGWQTAEILKGAEQVLKRERPDVVVVFGDTNSTLAGALAAAKLSIPIAHVEAGLRSFNRTMPEETNRVLTDHLSTLLFAPGRPAVENLNAEGIRHGIFEVGDVMYEAAMEFGKLAESKSTVLEQLGLREGHYCLATVHRAENTDDDQRVNGIVAALSEISLDETVVWPVHPRTRKCLAALSAARNRPSFPRLRLIDPLSYLDMLRLEKSARVVLTDSGGVQREAFWFHVPCLTLRNETEWGETLEGSCNQLVGAETASILSAFDRVVRSKKFVFPKNGQPARAGEGIVAALARVI